jgi:hypothetical protein
MLGGLFRDSLTRYRNPQYCLEKHEGVFNAQTISPITWDHHFV